VLLRPIGIFCNKLVAMLAKRCSLRTVLKPYGSAGDCSLLARSLIHKGPRACGAMRTTRGWSGSGHGTRSIKRRSRPPKRHLDGCRGTELAAPWPHNHAARARASTHQRIFTNRCSRRACDNIPQSSNITIGNLTNCVVGRLAAQIAGEPAPRQGGARGVAGNSFHGLGAN